MVVHTFAVAGLESDGGNSGVVMDLVFGSL